MSDIFVLDILKRSIQENVTSKMQLQKPTGNIKDYVLINPTVHIGWIPPKLPEGFIIEEQVPDMPCVLVGMDDGEDNNDDAGLNIRLSFVVYGPGKHETKDGSIKFTPDFQGYIDLLNFITKTRQELIRKRIIKSKTTVQHPFKWGMYKEQPYPYWCGWLTFRTSMRSGLYVESIAQQYL